MNKAEMQMGKDISELAGSFTDPILAWPGGWGATIPQWLKEAITMERLLENFKALKGEEMTGTDAEACAYLMTLSLDHPIDRDWTEIYLYVAGKVCQQHKKSEIPKDILVESLDAEQMRDLDHLKAWIYEKRVAIRQGQDRGERRVRKEEEAARKAEERPALFTL